MIVIVEKPFTGPAHWAQSYLRSNVRTPEGFGRVQEVQVDVSRGVVVLHVWVEEKKVKAKPNL